MNSFNHYAYGAIGEWLYSYVGGIRVDLEKPGYQHILLHPHTGGGLTYANTAFQSMYGEIQSNWKLEGNDFIYEVVIPANTTATVILSKAKAESLTVNSKPADQKLTPVEEGVSMELGAGKYQFRYVVK
jgi:alpha-L-rhamnosidase